MRLYRIKFRKSGSKIINLDQVVGIDYANGNMFRVILTGSMMVVDVPREEIDKLLKEHGTNIKDTSEVWGN